MPNEQGEAFFAAVVDPPEVPVKWTFNESELVENDRIKFGRDGGFCTVKVLYCITGFRQNSIKAHCHHEVRLQLSDDRSPPHNRSL